MLLRLTAPLFLMALLASPVNAVMVPAAPKTAIEQIRAQVQQDLEQFVAAQAAEFGRRIDFEVSRLDPRLNLPLCSQSPTTEFDGTSLQTRLSVRVICNGNQPWSLYVPVRLQAWQAVVTAAVSLARGQRVSAADLTMTEVDVSTLRYGHFGHPDEVIGMQLKRTLDAGTPLYPTIVTAPEVIRRGDAVIINARGMSMAVQAPGLALGDGRVGEQISVKNTSSERVIRATVVEAGVVEVRI